MYSGARILIYIYEFLHFFFFFFEILRFLRKGTRVLGLKIVITVLFVLTIELGNTTYITYSDKDL